jgi:hypothetical protein
LRSAEGIDKVLISETFTGMDVKDLAFRPEGGEDKPKNRKHKEETDTKDAEYP